MDIGKKFKIHLKMPLKTPKTNTAELGFGALLLVSPHSCVILHSSFCHLLLNLVVVQKWQQLSTIYLCSTSQKVLDLTSQPSEGLLQFNQPCDHNLYL
jgi:hypothetical protein